MKEVTIILNMLEGKDGEILERTRSHYVKKDENGLVKGQFHNRSAEVVAYKFTLTGMQPGLYFDLLCYNKRTKEKLVERKRANSAGILEVRYVVPACSFLNLEQVTDIDS